MIAFVVICLTFCPRVVNPIADRSFKKVLEHAKKVRENILTKTSLMLGVGEKDEEILQTMKDCRSVGVDVITFGQYLRPTPRHLAVKEYITPEKFNEWQAMAEDMGFVYAASGPLVRSSYKAGGEYFKDI